MPAFTFVFNFMVSLLVEVLRLDATPRHARRLVHHAAVFASRRPRGLHLGSAFEEATLQASSEL
jgi:hypothetical protein